MKGHFNCKIYGSIRAKTKTENRVAQSVLHFHSKLIIYGIKFAFCARKIVENDTNQKEKKNAKKKKDNDGKTVTMHSNGTDAHRTTYTQL